jgi:hypothetical protein
MKYMHQSIINTGINVFQTDTEFLEFILGIDTITQILQDSLNQLNTLAEQGALLTKSTTNTGDNNWNIIRIFNTPEQRSEYIANQREIRDVVFKAYEDIGWTIVEPEMLSEISEERWQEIQATELSNNNN